MAKKSETKVTRISASDSATKKNTAPKKAAIKPSTKKINKLPTMGTRAKKAAGPFGAIGRYFKGAWTELRQVHWPTRRATWGLTGAVLAFSAFFVLFITLLDAGFKLMFEYILK